MHLLFLRLRKYGAFDARLFIGALALFAINDYLVKPAVLGSAPTAGYSFFELLLLGHANDFLGGIAFVAYTNLLIALVLPRHRIRTFPVVVVYIFCCGLFWEYAAPLFVSDSVSDPWDLLAYCLGGAVYWLIARCFRDNGAKQPVPSR